MKIRLILTITCCFIASSALQAQLTYKPDKSICIGGSSTTRNLGLNSYNLPGFYWGYNDMYENEISFLKMDCTPANPRLSFSGNKVVINGNVYAGRFSVSSDSTRKHDIKRIEDGKQILQCLRNIHYSHDEKEGYNIDADALKKNLPDAVVDACNAQYVNYTELIPMLISGIKSLKDEIDSMQIEINNLENKTIPNQAKSRSYKPEDINLSHKVIGNRIILNYVIPSVASSAVIQVCNTKGAQVSSVNVLGTDRLVLSQSDFEGNRGFCSLIVDDIVTGFQEIEL